METFTTSSLTILPTEIFEWALQKGYATALWRLPDSKTIHCLIDFSEKIEPQPLQVDEFNERKGFIFSPFENESLQKIFFLNADFYSNSAQTLTAESIFLLKDFNSKYKEFSDTPRSPVQLILPNTDLEKTQHLHLVEKAVGAIKGKTFQKVVLSRKMKVGISDALQISYVFQNLCALYSSAFVSVVYVPNCNIWIGASPEILVSVDKNNIFRTMALAGTQKYPEEANLSEITWTQKEIEEQALVSRYIINAFKKIRLREFEEDGPRTIRAGNLAHLRTDFWVNLNEVHFPHLWQVMLGLLHPTSAVCGMPKDESLAFIRNFEGYDREFYSGFLGQVNIEQETHIFVNLRCMQILPSLQEAYVYAGGGITANSNPEKEWNETALKMETILKAIG
ncbi:isochorismate synthase [Raineya orbicola]|uniref:isochorismate synthase n=1 Tax=Raineya orbicola TaxID=2016530 RepID=A0A2N3IDH8_9BACT|nr:isochorismate synthase [Raineya orbicola]PKQ68325.1 Isochorismate synthase [Raineya orbicola]